MTWSIEPDSAGTFTLALRGDFPPDWAGAFCTGLSSCRINVERAWARQVQRGRWESAFVLRPLDQTVDLLRLDYRAMALASGKRAVRTRPRVSSFTLDDRRDSIRVSIRAADELGLLGSLLGSFSFLMLFVHEMTIETVGAEARDTFVLKGLAGIAPGAVERSRLMASLREMSLTGRSAA